MRVLNYQRARDRQHEARPFFRVLAGVLAAVFAGTGISFTYAHPTLLNIAELIPALAFAAMFGMLAITGRWPWRLGHR